MNSSTLLDEKSFYAVFSKDVFSAKNEIIIESPFITIERTRPFIPIFKQLVSNGIKIFVITRDPKEHDLSLKTQSEEIISLFERLGVQVLICAGNDHRKLAIIDRKILFEGSLNILSQFKSREIVRRIDDKDLALDMFNFLNLGRYI